MNKTPQRALYEKGVATGNLRTPKDVLAYFYAEYATALLRMNRTYNWEFQELDKRLRAIARTDRSRKMENGLERIWIELHVEIFEQVSEEQDLLFAHAILRRLKSGIKTKPLESLYQLLEFIPRELEPLMWQTRGIYEFELPSLSTAFELFEDYVMGCNIFSQKRLKDEAFVPLQKMERFTSASQYYVNYALVELFDFYEHLRKPNYEQLALKLLEEEAGVSVESGGVVLRLNERLQVETIAIRKDESLERLLSQILKKLIDGFATEYRARKTGLTMKVVRSEFEQLALEVLHEFGLHTVSQQVSSQHLNS